MQNSVYNVMTDVHVGSEKIRFTVHKAALMEKAEFFRGAFTQPFKEADRKHVELPEANVRAFELFHNWLYTGDVNEQVATG